MRARWPVLRFAFLDPEADRLDDGGVAVRILDPGQILEGQRLDGFAFVNNHFAVALAHLADGGGVRFAAGAVALGAGDEHALHRGLRIQAEAGPGGIEGGEIPRAAEALGFLEGAGETLQHRFAARGDDDGVERVVAIVGLAGSVRVLLEPFEAPAAAQLGGEGAGAGGDVVRRDRRVQALDEVHRQAAGVARVGEVAVAECLLHLGGIAAEVEAALLAALHGFAAFDAALEFFPLLRRFLVGEPFIGRAAALFGVGAGAAEGFVDETVVAEAAPGEDVIHLDAVVAGDEGGGGNRLVGVEAAAGLLVP